MKKNIVLLGVGSTYFTKGIVESLVTRGGEWDLRLVDIDAECLDIATRLSERVVRVNGAQVTVTGSTDRLELLTGAHAVVSTIGVGGRRAWEKDVLVPRDFGIFQSTGDTFGAGGVSRSIRMIPVLVDVAKDIESLCPDALFINFSNPLTAICRAIAKTTKLKVMGLCYGVEWYHHYLARLIKVPVEELSYRAIGVNHFTWITDLRLGSEDAWPLVRKAVAEKPSETEGQPYTWELFRLFDAFPCVGDGHICEFVPGWQGRGDYYGKTFGIDGHMDFEKYAKGFDRVFEEMRQLAYGKTPLAPLEPSSRETFKDEDFFIDVLNAYMGDGAADGQSGRSASQGIFRTVNLPNRGQASNILEGAVLEASTHISPGRFDPICFGEVAPGIAAIVNRIASVQELTVEAALRADRKLVLQALVAGGTVRTEAEANRLTDALLDAHREWLPGFFA